MQTIVFYEPGLKADTTFLNKEESHHCVKVLRLKEGDKLYITNGKGLFCEARLVKTDPKACLVHITESYTSYGKRSFSLHIAIAPTKSIDRFEWFLEKATECGADIITPVLCKYSERKVIKPGRLEKVMIAAMKQSGRAYLPVMKPFVKFSEFIDQHNDGECFIAHCAKGKKHSIFELIKKGKDITIAIGPEGDFSEDEISQATIKGFKAISIGEHRLRTETAAIAACVQINAINGLL